MPQNPRHLLLEWYSQAKRDLPWRRTRDPWAILLSEVMLQQTRVTAVLPYYQKFLARFPTPQAMAAAPEQEVLTLWAGLGYYSRARNLQKAAATLSASGAFPETLDAIRALPGVGEYTASAIGSICFNIPSVVVDGNVLRVMSRFTAEAGDIRSSATRDRLRKAAQHLLDPKQPAEFNQALMELGATVCLPRKPLCLLCPWKDHCVARRQGIQAQLPVKLGRPLRLQEEKTLLLIESRGRILVRQRGASENRLAGFWELPELSMIERVTLQDKIGEFSHSITRHDYVITVRRGSVAKAGGEWIWKPLAGLQHLPLSTMSRKALALAGLA